MGLKSAEESKELETSPLISLEEHTVISKVDTLRVVLEKAIQPFGYWTISDLASISSNESAFPCQRCQAYEGLLRALANVLLSELQMLQERPVTDAVKGASLSIDTGQIQWFPKILNFPSFSCEDKNTMTPVEAHNLFRNACAQTPPFEESYGSTSFECYSVSTTSEGPLCTSSSWLQRFLHPSPEYGNSGSQSPNVKIQPNSASGFYKGLQRRNVPDSSDSSVALPSPKTTYVRRGVSYTLLTISDVNIVPDIKETNRAVTVRRDGRKMINDYILLRDLNRGSYGQVVLVQHSETKEKYAMKIIQLSKKLGNKGVMATRSEIAVMKAVVHPHLVRLHEVIGDKSKKAVYLIMQYISRGSIARALSPTTIEPIPEVKLRHIAAQILSALKHLHANNVFHRDIKPDNILMDENGNAFLTDFGTSGICTGAGLRGVVGTPAFMSPEVCSGKKQVVGELVDVWALGITLYQLMYGFLPFSAPTYLESMRKIVDCPVTFPDESGVSDDSKVITSWWRRTTASRRISTMSALNKKISRKADIIDGGVESEGSRVVTSSPEFKELIRGMLCKEPEYRWTLHRIGKSAWLSDGLDTNDEDAFSGFSVRKRTLPPIQFSELCSEKKPHVKNFGGTRQLPVFLPQLSPQAESCKITEDVGGSVFNGSTNSSVGAPKGKVVWKSFFSPGGEIIS